MTSKRGMSRASKDQTKVETPKVSEATGQPISKESQAAIDLWKAKQAQADESAKLSTDAGKTNEQQLTYAEDADDNAMLTRAAQFGEKIGDDPDYQHDAEAIEVAGRVNDTKIVMMLKHLERRLSKDDLAFLPRPMSTRAEAMAGRKEGDNSPLLYDKPKASGGRSKVETFYSNLVKHTPLGKKAVARLEALAKEIKQIEAKPDNDTNRDIRVVTSDIEDCNRTLRNLTNSMRAAAEVRVVINELREHKNIVVSWIRGPMPEGAVLPPDYDKTMLNCPEAGEVVQVSRCLLVYNTAGYADPGVARDRAKPYSLGTVKRWKVANAQLWRAKSQTPRSYINMDDLIASPKPPAKAGAGTTGATAAAGAQITIAKAKRYEADGIADVQSLMTGLVSWYQGSSASEQATNDKTLDNLIDHSDEGNSIGYKLYMILAAKYDNSPVRRDKAKEYLKALEAKLNQK